MVTDSAARPPRPARSESREALELQSIRAQHPELVGAVNMHLELLELQRRIQGRVPLPMLDLSPATLQRHQLDARPLLRFEDIPLDLTDLRLMVRQTADVLRRYGALEQPDYDNAQALGRDMQLLAAVGRWYRGAEERQLAVAAVSSASEEAALGDDEHVAFSRAFGPLELPPGMGGRISPLIYDISNLTKDGEIKPPNPDGAQPTDFELFHTDSPFNSLPTKWSLLLAYDLVFGHRSTRMGTDLSKNVS